MSRTVAVRSEVPISGVTFLGNCCSSHSKKRFIHPFSIIANISWKNCSSQQAAARRLECPRLTLRFRLNGASKLGIAFCPQQLSWNALSYFLEFKLQIVISWNISFLGIQRFRRSAAACVTFCLGCVLALLPRPHCPVDAAAQWL